MIGVLALVLILLLFNLYFQWANAPYSEEEQAVEQRAIDAAGLTEVIRSDKFVWDQTVWVVQGTNADDEHLFVWIEGDQIDTVRASDSYPPADVKAAVLAKKPDVRILRIQPGLLEGERVWEVYYSRTEAVERHYYDIYGFDDGRFIKEYRLPARSSG